LFFESEILKVEFEILKEEERCCVLKISCVRTSFLMKIDDKKGHVFELMCSDELYNFARGGEKRSIFGYKSFNVLFWKKNKVTTR
jgi:hypothetical protein